MDLGFADKKVLISGSTGGIGFATAVAFAREGARVWVNGRTQARVDEAIQRVRAAVKDARVEGIAADLGNAAGAAAVVAALPEVDVLVNNFGIFEPKPFEDIPDEDWLRFFESNVMSGVRLSRHYFPGMLKKNWGRIIFVSSESGVQIPAEMIHYGTTKTAQLAIARGLAERTAGTGVTVNSVLPGPTRSEGVDQFVRDLASAQGVPEAQVERDFFQKTRPSSLLQRFARTDEVADMIVYVASEKASATNGAALRCDGGVVRAIV
jgi:hypothetical protein